MSRVFDGLALFIYICWTNKKMIREGGFSLLVTILGDGGTSIEVVVAVMVVANIC